MTNKAVYAGTFDPITLGHVDVVTRAAALFDEVVIAVAVNERKKPYFPAAKRVQMVQLAVQSLSNVVVESYAGLTIDFVQQHQAHYLVRGLRSASDFEYEAELAEMNFEMLDGKVETIFLPTRPQYALVSSSVVRELISMKEYDQLKRFIPESLLGAIA